MPTTPFRPWLDWDRLPFFVASGMSLVVERINCGCKSGDLALGDLYLDRCTGA